MKPIGIQLKAILAATADGVIGDQVGLPWRCAPDLAFFKSMTQDSVLIMGYTTFKLMAAGWPQSRDFLPTRTVVVVTSKPESEILGMVHTMTDKSKRLMAVDFELAHKLIANGNHTLWAADDDAKVFVVGGSQLFEALIDYCDTIYLTTITLPLPLTLTMDHVTVGPKLEGRLKTDVREEVAQFVDEVSQVSAHIELLKPS